MNKVVLITGASVNTGVAIVNKFASEGFDVVFTDLDEDKVKAKEKEYQDSYPNVRIKGFKLNSVDENADIDEAALDNFFNELDKLNMKPNCLVLNAASLGINMEVFKTKLKDFQKVINTNIVWNYAIVERAALRMKELGGGNIVFINSNTAYRAIPNRIAYSASKGGQLGMMRALALDLGKYHISVNAVLPGMIVTDRWEKNPEAYETCPSRFTPLGNVAHGIDIAEAAYFFCAVAKNSTGSELTVDGGNMIQLYPIIPEDKK